MFFLGLPFGQGVQQRGEREGRGTHRAWCLGTFMTTQCLASLSLG